MESHLKHPINQFRLIRRYHKDWPYIRKLLGLDAKSKIWNPFSDNKSTLHIEIFHPKKLIFKAKNLFSQ